MMNTYCKDLRFIVMDNLTTDKNAKFTCRLACAVMLLRAIPVGRWNIMQIHPNFTHIMPVLSWEFHLTFTPNFAKI